MKKIPLICLALLIVSGCETASRLTVCMIYTDIGKMRCSTGGGEAFDVEFQNANHFVCMPKDDAQIVFDRLSQCEQGGQY